MNLTHELGEITKSEFKSDKIFEKVKNSSHKKWIDDFSAIELCALENMAN